jgi:hypothetical protein
MKIDRQELLTALVAVKPALAAKEIIEQSTSFCFLEGRVITYNDEISISHPLSKMPFTGAINAEELYAFINRIKVEQVDIDKQDTHFLFKAGRAKAGFLIQEEIVLPLEEIGDIKKWKNLPDNFLKALEFSIGACATNMSTPILTCVHITSSKMVSSDNYRIAQYSLDKQLPIHDFLLPATIAAKVIKMHPIKIAEGEGWVHFKTKKGTVISCRILDDIYPQTDDFFNFKGKKLILPDNLLDILERAGTFSKRDYMLDETITVTIKKNTIIVRSESATGWFTEKNKIKYSDDEIEFKITPYLLKDILSKTNEAFLGDDRMSFSQDIWKYLTMLKK